MRNWIFIILFSLGGLVASSQEPQDSIFEEEEEVRVNPDIEAAESTPISVERRNYRAYPFLNLKSNNIELNGADWNGLRDLFEHSYDTIVSIVHIGDSHIQCEGAPLRTRALLQRKYGSAGRGLVIPFRLAGTNNPLDYSIKSTTSYKAARMMKHPWPMAMGFTGISLQPETKKFDFTISLNENDGIKSDFDIIRMFKSGATPRLLSVISDDGMPALYNDFVAEDTLTIFLYQPLKSVTLNFASEEPCQVHGFSLDNQMVGVKYSAIGNNGAAFTSYNSIGNIGKSISALAPSLIIVSLGANEAFGRTTDVDFYREIDTFVSDLLLFNPDAQLLLVTPSECQRSKTTRVGKGKKRRKVKSYSVNQNIPRLRNVILRYGKDHNIATYDWYSVAGGVGSSDKWLAPKLMNTDRIHLTWSGYALQGELFYDALVKALN